MKTKVVLLLILFSLNSFSQKKYLDSLWSVWSDEKQADTTRLRAMYDFAWDGYLFAHPDSSFYFSKIMYDFALEKDLKKFQAKALNLQFNYYLAIGDFSKAMEKNKEAAELRKQDSDKLGMAVAYSNFGILYQIQGNFSKAIDNFVLSLKYNEEVGNKIGVATSLHNIGHLYQEQNNFTQALNYYDKSLKIREAVGDTFGIATSLINISSVCQQLGDYKKAMESINLSLKINTRIGNKQGIAASLGNIGMIYQAQKEYVKAIDYYNKCLIIQEEIGNKQTSGISFLNIGSVYYELNNFPQAIYYSNKALEIAKNIGDITGIKNASNALYNNYKKSNKYKEALMMHELYIQMLDSINSEESKKEIVRQEFKYQYEKKVVSDSIRSEEEKKIVAMKFEKEQTQRYLLYFGLLLLIAFGGMMYNRFRNSQKQKNIIAEQKRIVEEKQNEIIDSIHYAQKIQHSLLPNEKHIEKELKRLKK